MTARPLGRGGGGAAYSTGGLMRTGGAIDNELDWQPWVTLKTGAGLADIAMDSDYWINLSPLSAVVARTVVLNITGGSLILQTASTTDGPWRDLVSYTTAGVNGIVIGTEGNAPTSMRRYLRWFFDTPAGAASVTFRIGLAPATDTSGVVTLPDFKSCRSCLEGYSEVQPWVTVRGGYIANNSSLAQGHIIASAPNWLNTGKMEYLFTEVEVADITALTGLVIETAMHREGPWVAQPAITAVGATRTKFTMEGSYATNLARYFRWHIETTGQPWYVCFRIAAKWA